MAELARRTASSVKWDTPGALFQILLRALAMRNRLFIELFLLLTPKVKFREVDTVPAVIEREPKHSLLG